MIIKNDFFQENNNYLMQEKEGLNKAIKKLDDRFKKEEIDREKFLKQNQEFAKKQIELNKRIDKLNRK